MSLNMIRPARELTGSVDLRRMDSHPDHWYPIAWSEKVKPAKMLACHYAGEPVAVIRGTDGKLFALENRCAHRQVPLTKGVVHGCTVKCGYHGWAYDAAGGCIDVPYLGNDHLPNGVKAYPCREIGDLIFVFAGDPRLAEGRRPPSLGARADRSYKICVKADPLWPSEQRLSPLTRQRSNKLRHMPAGVPFNGSEPVAAVQKRTCRRRWSGTRLSEPIPSWPGGTDASSEKAKRAHAHGRARSDDRSND